MFILIAEFGTLDYGATGAAAPSAANGTVTAVALLLLLAAVGKSAQIPLFPWLTDAMEGPTPVSALIHAATMVTAGVYLIARAHPFFEASGDALTVVVWVGVLTALLAGGAALVQPDIKRVLAYSTISQLGYMFLALGVQAYTAAVFMVLMHAFFKGCLFLGAGSVIHGNAENQDIRIMGAVPQVPAVHRDRDDDRVAGDRRRPAASRGSGPKDEILESAFLAGDYGVWALGLIAAVFTALYMTRLIQLVFYGNERFRDSAVADTAPAVSGGSDDDAPDDATGTDVIDPADTPEALGYDPDFLPTVSFTEATPRASRLHGHDPHESPVIMVIPILVLATLSIFGGLINLPLDGLDFLDQFLEPVFAGVHQPHPDSFVAGTHARGHRGRVRARRDRDRAPCSTGAACATPRRTRSSSTRGGSPRCWATPTTSTTARPRSSVGPGAPPPSSSTRTSTRR